MCGLNESLFVDTAHAMVKFGLRDAGYNRLNLDDCWSLGERAANGSMQWDPEKFPRGLPWLTSYLKSLGFNTGIYTDAGLKSCGGYPCVNTLCFLIPIVTSFALYIVSCVPLAPSSFYNRNHFSLFVPKEPEIGNY